MESTGGFMNQIEWNLKQAVADAAKKAFDKELAIEAKSRKTKDMVIMRRIRRCGLPES